MLLSMSDILSDNTTYRVYTNKSLGLIYLYWDIGSYSYEATVGIDTYEVISYSKYDKNKYPASLAEIAFP